MSTHDLELALDMDRVLVVEAGRIAFDGGAAAAVEHYRSLCAGGGALPNSALRNRARADRAAADSAGADRGDAL